MLKIRTASTELTLGAFCYTQHSCKECRQIAFISVTHNIYAKSLCYLSDKQLLFAADMPPFQCPRSSPFPDMAPVPGPKAPRRPPRLSPPRCMPAVRNGRLPSASSSKMLAGSSDLCAATIKCTDCGHNRTARKRRRARNHAIQHDRNALRRRTQIQTAQTRDIKPPTLCSTSIESFESGL